MIYWLVWIFICLSSIFVDYKNIVSKFLFFYFFIFLFFFIGFRYQVGGDWYSYLLMHDLHGGISLSDALLISDPAYSLLNFLSFNLGFQDTIFVNSICAFIACCFLFFSFLKLGNYWYCLLIYFPYHILVVSLGYTRQSVAIAIVIYSFLVLLERKNLYFIFLVLLAFLFHQTAVFMILMLPLYFFSKTKILKWSYFCISFIFLFLIFYFSNKYEINSYVSSETDLASSGVFLRLSAHFIPIVVYILYRKFFINSNKNYCIYLDYSLFLILFFLVLAFNFSTLSDRFNLYLVFFDIFVILFLSKFIKISNRRLLCFLIILYYSVFMWIWMFYGNYATKAWLPYRNYITEFIL